MKIHPSYTWLSVTLAGLTLPQARANSAFQLKHHLFLPDDLQTDMPPFPGSSAAIGLQTQT